jgi:hypothetical protein
VAHCVQDAARKQRVVSRLCQTQRLNEVPLSKAMNASVIGHPGRQKGRFRDSVEEVATNLLGVLSVEHARRVGSQVLDESPASITTAEVVV